MEGNSIMKIVVSDYDNTFYTNDESIKRNVSSVNNFMKNNMFIIATGRSFDDFKKKEIIYGIPYNYLIINHGATVLKNNKIIYNVFMDNSITDKLINDLRIETAVKSFICSGLKTKKISKMKNLTKIQVRYGTQEDAKKTIEMLNKKYLNKVKWFLGRNQKEVEIVSKDVDKSKAIKFIANLEEVDKKDIYTIGDYYTDIEMIKNFNGFAMAGAIKELKDVAIREYDSVSDLIIDIMNV